MGRHVPTPFEQTYINELVARGYKVVRASTYARWQRKLEIAASEVAWERDRREHAEQWARNSLDAERRIMDRLDQVCIAAAALGVPIAAINSALGEADWQGAQRDARVAAITGQADKAH